METGVHSNKCQNWGATIGSYNQDRHTWQHGLLTPACSCSRPKTKVCTPQTTAKPTPFQNLTTNEKPLTRINPIPPSKHTKPQKNYSTIILPHQSSATSTNLTSILGPPPSRTPIHSPLIKKTITSNMSNLTEADERLIQKFIGLSTSDLQNTALALLKSASPSTDWSLCLFAKIITDRSVIDAPFAKLMTKLWGADASTKILHVGRCCYLVEFENTHVLQRALLMGP